ncbi:MAG: PAS domain-containing protein [Maribacter sp.]|nr:PAS domain-containing protein [Maribacter sp.]
MNNLFTTDFIKTAPVSVAILDKNLCFTSYSKIWLKEFNIKEKNILGKHYYDVIPNTPEQLRKVHQNGLHGKSSKNIGKKCIDTVGNIQWLKWKVDPWNDYEGNNSGIIIFAEDITNATRKKELLKKSEKVGKIGGWELDLGTNQLYWTDITKKILEVANDYTPKLEEDINFFKEGLNRDKCINLIGNCIEKGRPFDEELQIITAKGHERWVRFKGDAELFQGKCVRLFGTFQDIDSEKRIEIKYNKTAERLKVATNTAKIGIWEFDIVTNELVWNDPMFELFGIEREEFTGNYEAWKACVHQDDQERSQKEMEMALNGEKDIDTDFRVVWPNGTIRHIKASAIFHKDEEGRVRKIIGANWDITAIKEAQLKFKEVADRLNVATSAAQIGIWEYDIANDDLVWNDQMFELYGVKKKEFSGVYTAWQARLHPEDREQAEEEATKAMLGEKDYENIFRVVWPNGEIKYIQAVGVLHWDKEGRPNKVIGASWDITPIKEAQLKYKEVADRLKVATNAAQIGIWEYDIANDSSVWDDQVYKLYGITKEDFNGGDAEWRTMIHPEDQEKIRKEEEMALKGVKDLNHNFRVVWPNGTIRHLQSAAVILKDEEGNPIKIIGTNWDITPIKEAEEELRKLLEVTNEQNNNLLNFAHIVSHNLRSHSSNLSMLSSFLIKEENEKERKKLITMIDEASSGLNETVQHLDEVVHVKTNVDGNMASINLHKALKNVEKNISTLFQEKEVICEIDVPKTHNLKAVPAYLDSILLNLFTNSVKYSALNRQPHIMVSSKIDGNKIVVAFSDNGQGIDLDRHGRKIFGMYKTFHGNKDAKGIGLFITKNQIEAMNGKIEVESTVNVGTTFNLYFDAN